ncbi:hypothetical protein CBL_01348 [Carabus blaptoides fortunei]
MQKNKLVIESSIQQHDANSERETTGEIANATITRRVHMRRREGCVRRRGAASRRHGMRQLAGLVDVRRHLGSTSNRTAITRNLSMRQSNELDGIDGGSGGSDALGGGDRDFDFTEKTVSHATFRFGFISGGRKFYSLRFFRKYRVIDFTLRVHGVELTIGNVGATRWHWEGHYEVPGSDDTSSYVSIATCQREVSACGHLCRSPLSQ